MLVEALSGDSLIHRVDPRARIVVAALFAVAVAPSVQYDASMIALAVALGFFAAASLPLSVLLRRLLPLNAMVLILGALLVIGGEAPRMEIAGPLSVSESGLHRALLIALKANAVLIAITALLGTIEPVALGHALESLRVPPKLTRLFLFTVRYLEVLRLEYLRLRRAMSVRAFTARTNLHTLRSMGYLVGVLLVRAFDRAERVQAAMKCRGFDGHYPVLRHARATRSDWAFGVACACACVLLAWWGWQ